jgi:hypothetical protein
VWGCQYFINFIVRLVISIRDTSVTLFARRFVNYLSTRLVEEESSDGVRLPRDKEFSPCLASEPHRSFLVMPTERSEILVLDHERITVAAQITVTPPWRRCVSERKKGKKTRKTKHEIRKCENMNSDHVTRALAERIGKVCRTQEFR